MAGTFSRSAPTIDPLHGVGRLGGVWLGSKGATRNSPPFFPLDLDLDLDLYLDLGQKARQGGGGHFGVPGLSDNLRWAGPSFSPLLTVPLWLSKSLGGGGMGQGHRRCGIGGWENRIAPMPHFCVFWKPCGLLFFAATPLLFDQGLCMAVPNIQPGRQLREGVCARPARYFCTNYPHCNPGFTVP